METNDINQTVNMAERTMIAAPVNGAQATLMGAPIKCPVCQTENSPTEKYCGDCGFLLSSAPGEAVEVPDAAAMPKLVDAVHQREYLLRSGENTVGREATDVLLDDPTVSRRHALLVIEDGACWVEDLGSTNGTSVDGNRLTQGNRVQASDNAEIKFGSSVLSLSVPAVEPAQETEPAEEPEALAVSDVVTDDAAAVDAEAEPAAEVAEPQVETEVAPEEPAEAAVEASPVARFVGVDDPSLSFDIKEGTNGIGRRSDSDIAITTDAYVSGVHADLDVEGGAFYLTDLGSTNGTMINKSKISPGARIALNNGDEVAFGKTTLRFEVLDQVSSDVESDSGIG